MGTDPAEPIVPQYQGLPKPPKGVRQTEDVDGVLRPRVSAENGDGDDGKRPDAPTRSRRSGRSFRRSNPVFRGVLFGDRAVFVRGKGCF